MSEVNLEEIKQKATEAQALYVLGRVKGDKRTVEFYKDAAMLVQEYSSEAKSFCEKYGLDAKVLKGAEKKFQQALFQALKG